MSSEEFHLFVSTPRQCNNNIYHISIVSTKRIVDGVYRGNRWLLPSQQVPNQTQYLRQNLDVVNSHLNSKFWAHPMVGR